MSVRTESKVMRAAPGEEQDVIDFMQKLFWNLLTTQEIKTSDNYLQKKNDAIYQVHSTDHYVKMAFSRYLDTPHLDKIRTLEKEYFDLPEPVYPKLFPFGIWTWLIGGVIFIVGLFTTMKASKALPIGLMVYGFVWIVYFLIKYSPDKERADRQAEQLVISRGEIIERLKHIETLNV